MERSAVCKGETKQTEWGKVIWETLSESRVSVGQLNMALDALPPVKTDIYLSNFYQLNGYSPESPIGGT